MKKMGVSLIVLVITVIVILILAGIIIFAITQSGVVDNAKKAKFMSDFRSVEEGVNIYSISNITASNPTDYKLPIEGKLTLSDKQAIVNNVPTLKTKIEELNPGKTIDNIELYWINEPVIGANNIPSNKQAKGYIIDVATGQIYDYIGDVFENRRWHTLDSGVIETSTTLEEVQELWDGWIRLTLYYPNSSTDKKWRLGTEGELRVDPMLMWQDYTGPINIPLDRIHDVWIKYRIGGREVIIPPAGTLLVDIEPDSTGPNLLDRVNVRINYDETATVKEYRVGDSGWMPYTGPFDVTENCIIEARAKKTENIYNTDGSLLMTRDIAGSDMIYIGNIGMVESPLPAPTITRLDPQNSGEKARVKVDYPVAAVRKIFKINYGVEQDYTGEISVTAWGTHIIAYYYDVNGRKSNETSILINDTSTGTPPEPPESHTPDPPHIPGTPPPFNPRNNPRNLLAPTITRLDPQSSGEKARVKVVYPAEAVTKVFIQNYGNEQSYTGEISVTAWGTYIEAYYYDQYGNRSPSAKIMINETSTPPVTDPPGVTDEENIPLPIINITPNTGYVSQVSVSLSLPTNANNTFIKIGRYGEYQSYTGPVIVRDNEEIYAYYVTYSGRRSGIARARITNIQRPAGGDPGSGRVQPYVNITANPYPWPGSTGASLTTVTVQYRDSDTIEYSEDGVIYRPYTGPFTVTRNERVYARGTNANGVTEDYLDITNIGQLTPPTQPQILDVSINANPEPSLTTVNVASVTVSIEYDSRATDKLYRIGLNGTLQNYTGPFEVTQNCTIYAYASATNAVGHAEKAIDNIVDGISNPIISSIPTNRTQASRVTIGIGYDRNATVKRYSINGGALRDYTGTFEVTENGTIIYAYSENAKGQHADSTYTVQNIIPRPPVLVLDRGSYYLLKLNYPEGSSGREYKWKVDGTWKTYKEAGIMLIKPQFQDQVIQNGTVIKIEDENGNLVTFTGDYYLIDVPTSQLSENLFMRWDRVTPAAPQIVLNTTSPAKQVTATIIYDNTLVKKKYRVVKPGETPGAWQDYTGPIIVDKNNSVIYAKGQDDTEMWSTEGMCKVTNIDEISPVITLTADLSTAGQSVPIKVAVTDNTGVSKVKWASGTLGESYFETAGTEISNNSIVNITQNGYYTFYAEDVVGNIQVYTLNVSNVDLTPPAIDISVSPENTVGLTANVTINYGDSIASLKQYKVGTSNPTWSNYTGTFTISSYTILSNNWQNSDGTVTIYAKGKDSAGNEITVQKKIMNLDLDKPAAPIIISNSGYPIITSYGVRFDGATTITYDNRTDIDNYYSIDNGVTWQTYIGQFNMTSGTVIAKSVKRNTGLEVTSSYTVSLPADALPSAAYDGNDSTNSGYVNNVYIAVDSSMRQKNARLRIWTLNANSYIIFLDQNKQEISRLTRGVTGTGKTYDEIITIPANTSWIEYSKDNVSDVRLLVQEIQPSNEPTFSSTNGYMLFSADPTRAIHSSYQMVSINYFSTSVQRLYRIGTTGDWLNYNDQPIKVDQGQTIYAKGIDQNGNETRIISSYTANVTDALLAGAYDGNDTTHSGYILSNTYMAVDSSMRGKNTRLRIWTVGANAYIIFLDQNKQEISRLSRGVTGAGKTYDEIITIPTNTSWIVFNKDASSNVSLLVQEIQPSNEPTFSSTNGYMLLSADPTKAIHSPYQMVSINYFPTSVQRLYRIGTTGDWLNYNNQPIKVDQGQTIYAKGIDIYGNETRIISSYTANVLDALPSSAYDGNDSTNSGYVNNVYIAVDSSMRGKNVRSNIWTLGANSYIIFLDQNKQEISRLTRGVTGAGKTYDEIITIPANTSWIEYSRDNVSGVLLLVKEIQPNL